MTASAYQHDPAIPLGRVVDQHNHGWLARGDGNYWGFDPHTRASLADRPLAAIVSEFGSYRPVLPLLDDDHTALVAAFDVAGRNTIASVASAVEQVFHEARRRSGPATGDAADDYGYAVRTLTAGRPGSWEAAALLNVVFFGTELNLHPHDGKHTVDQMRATGPNRRRVHLEARDAIADVLRRWTDSPDRYTEVAETLAFVVSQYADDRYGPDGWRQIADQWLQPGGLGRENFGACYGLLYSVSAHFNADLLP